MKSLTQIVRSKKFMVLMSIMLIVALLVLLGSKTSPEVVPNSPVITSSTDKPVETAPEKKSYQWVGGSDEPKYIELPSISAGGFIQKVDVDQNNEMATPNNIHMAAWFLKSSLPGDPGLSIIDGHVTGRVNDGIFKKLGDLKIGDIYTVELGNGKIKKFRVIKMDTVDAKDATNVLFSQDPKVRSQLNLITCAGTFDTVTRKYDKRIIVSSEYLN